MRSIILHFVEADLNLNSELTALCAANGDGWLWADEHDDPVLYISRPQSFASWANSEGLSAHERREIEDTAGGRLALSLIVDVSGRHAGDTEVNALAQALLSRFRGFVMDEYTDHLWTLEEIAAGRQVQGHGFFDYRGWYAENQGL